MKTEIATKRCTECGEEKSLDDFHRNRRMKDGHVNQCKECSRPRKRQYNRQNRDVLNAAHKRYEERNPDYVRRQRKKRKLNQQERYPEKVAARKALTTAVELGRVAKPDICERCGGKFLPTEIHGHHRDYSKPLEVEWLCVDCHTHLHREANSDA